MPKISAGLIMYRIRDGKLEILLTHPGGPFYTKKDDGFWGIPRGEVADGEELMAAARREFAEETGLSVAPECFIYLDTSLPYTNGKIVHAWAFEGDCDPAALISNTFEMEWPPHSGKQQSFPEVDRFGFFTAVDARKKMSTQQIPLLERLENSVKETLSDPTMSR